MIQHNKYADNISQNQEKDPTCRTGASASIRNRKLHVCPLQKASCLVLSHCLLRRPWRHGSRILLRSGNTHLNGVLRLHAADDNVVHAIHAILHSVGNANTKHSKNAYDPRGQASCPKNAFITARVPDLMALLQDDAISNDGTRKTTGDFAAETPSWTRIFQTTARIHSTAAVIRAVSDQHLALAIRSAPGAAACLKEVARILTTCAEHAHFPLIDISLPALVRHLEQRVVS